MRKTHATLFAASLALAASLVGCAAPGGAWSYDFVIEEGDTILASPRLTVRDGQPAEIRIEDEETGELIRVEIMANEQIRVDLRQRWAGELVEPTVLMEPDSEAVIMISGGPEYRVRNERTRVSDDG